MIVALAATALAAFFLCMWIRAELDLAETTRQFRWAEEALAKERRAQTKALPDPTDHRRSVA